ncbi:S24 family peptidase [Pectobacterium betavasculorum]|uniref:S24 family peptidase n=1 Tax=Pectobacterium betavasculorum TaxID=55207 RepID=UPI00068F153B|nr:helix-turn-helix transcriptional regulator [Pectobacterium betavasculorum]
MITGNALGESGTSHKAASDVLGNNVDIGEFVFIPRYDVRAAAGHGALNETETPKFSMAFRKYWIKNFLNTDPHHLFVITVDGSSLEGTLNDGDNILVNGADTDPKEGIYVLRVDGHLLVKLVQRVPGGLLKVSSTNTAYEPFTVDMNNQPEDFAIIGRVVWFGRTI